MSTQGPPARRHAEDRHVVPPGRAVPQPRACSRRPASSTRPTGSTPLPRRARPDAAAVGRPAGRGGRRLGRARRAGPRRHDGHRDHQPRDPRDRLAGPGRPGARVARATATAPRSTSCSRVRDLVRQIPAEWQENVKHRAQLSYGAFLDQIHDPERDTRIGAWFWGVQEIPEILDRWGQDLPPEHVHLVTVPPPGGAPELLWKRFSQAFGLDGIDLDLEAERHNPSLGVPETTLVRRDQPRRQRRAGPGRLPPAGPRAARPPDPVAADRLAAAGAAAGPAPVGRRSSRRRGSPRSSAAGTTWSATSTTWSARRRSAEYADPDQPRERQVAAAARRRDHGAAARQRPAAARGGAAARRARRRARRAGAGLRDARRTALRRGDRACGWRTAGVGRAAARGLPAGAGQELAVGVAADLPGRRRRRRPSRRSRRRSGSGGRPSSPAACRPPW